MDWYNLKKNIKNENKFLLFFALIGLLLILKIFYKFIMKLHQRYVYNNRMILIKKFNDWAIVTGATDGIGKATAFELAKRGINVVLISRSEDKLIQTCKEIEEKYKTDINDISTKYLVIDYMNFNKENQQQVKDLVDELNNDLSILVNNVGISYEFPEYFHELTDERVEALIKLNIDSTTYMTRICLPAMLKRSEDSRKSKKSAIINVGSAAGIHSNPLLAQYSAAKSYILALSESLNAEYSPKGIFVSCHTPYFIVSKLSKHRKSSLLVPTPQTYAKLLVNNIGYNESHVNPYLPHALIAYLLTSLPTSLLASNVLSFHLGIRKRGQRKRLQKQEEQKQD